MKNNEKENLWEELNDESHVWPYLRRYGNTVLGYTKGVNLLRKIWHKKYSRQAPENFMKDKKYAKRYQECLKEIEDYISEKFGKKVKIRYVKDITAPDKFYFFVSGKKDVVIGYDFWVLEVQNH